ncbi:hypothetical protein CMUST_11335 [Corynebacterium mustelae]|uniref:Uncharacterized protein n=1 Tax=Corynebacterium mustelae TaxID=571915 RepID=A0A0G3H1C0_9CORY|nr:hypothetical protein [Corynebacterium mustelae]AKK06580.1 hypothetical protein CMUST_11335 [Corynebacterium mustelae]
MDHPHSPDTIVAEEYDFNRLISRHCANNGSERNFLVSFWQQRVDPTDEFDELYWHETGYILRGVTDALTAIAWEKEHAAGRHSATFALIPADPYPLIDDETLEASTSDTPPQRDQAIHIHGTIPDGRILNDSNFFEFCMYADPKVLEQ